METAKRRHDLAADEAAKRVVIARIDAELEAFCAAVGLGLVAPDGQERPDDTVLALRADAGRRAARGEAVEDGLHLIRSGVPRRPPAILRERVTKVAELLLGAAVCRLRLYDLGPEALAAEPRVLLGL